jgi:tetratricopeptide (TPR) repeat protein
VQTLLGGYASSLSTMATDACLDARVRGEASERALALRTACLEERHRELRALVGVLSRADAQVVENAVGASRSLPPLAPCEDVDWLMEQVPPPTSLEAQVRLGALREALAEARALHVSGKYAEAISRVGPVVEGARALPFPPLEAEALLQLGLSERSFGQDAKAEGHLEEAMARGLSANHREVPGMAAAELLAIVAPSSVERAAEARRWYALGQAFVSRAHRDRERTQAALVSAHGHAQIPPGRFAEAEQAQREALALAEKAYGADSWELAPYLNRLGSTLRRLKRYSDALPLHQRAIDITRAHLGGEHPTMVMLLQDLGTTLHRLGRHEEAISTFQEALALGRRTLAPNHRAMAATAHSLGLALDASKQLAEAEQAFLLALELSENAYGPDSAIVNLELRSLLWVYNQTREHQKARPHAERALRIAEAKLPPHHPGHLHTRMYAAAMELLAGRPQVAVAHLQKLLAQEKAAAADPATFGEARFLLARALWATGRPRGEVQALLAEARAQLAPAGEQTLLADIEAWAGREKLALATP